MGTLILSALVVVVVVEEECMGVFGGSGIMGEGAADDIVCGTWDDCDGLKDDDDDGMPVAVLVVVVVVVVARAPPK